jgi:16S rRNA (guanine527-N7)-methyltransferase
MTSALVDDATALSGIIDVSRETVERLEAFVALLTKWQSSTNLVAPSTLPAVWRRHIADSAQLVSLFPQALKWVDLGSGGGFPAVVVAILFAGREGADVRLIESDQRKCAFLRQAIRQAGAPAEVHNGRIETVLAGWSRPVDMISSRALAPLSRLFPLAEPLFAAGATAAFHKGLDFEAEISEASKYWDADLVIHKSKADSAGVILEVRSLTRKPAGSAGASS